MDGARRERLLTTEIGRCARIASAPPPGGEIMDDASYKRLLNHKRIVKDLLLGFIAPRRPPQ